MIYINDKIEKITERELSYIIERLPEWRRAQMYRFKHLQGQKECAISYDLLCQGLRERGHDVLPTFVYGQNGKPTLMELPDVHFNLSHCRVAVACAVSDEEVGIDVEVLGRYKPTLARHTMNAEELQEIANADSPDIAFTRLWTMKEAYAKLTGEGLTTNVRELLSHSSNIIYKTIVSVEKGYVVTMAKRGVSPTLPL